MRVLIINHGKAPHGYYETFTTLDGDERGAEEATFVRPGQSMVLNLPEAHMGPTHVPPDATLIKNPTDEDIAARGATHSVHAQAITDASDDGDRAAAGANAQPEAAKALGDGHGPVEDDFTTMDDDQLRAFITTRDGKAPHHMFGHEKLLAIARTEPEAVG